jgi:hypothetical protein
MAIRVCVVEPQALFHEAWRDLLDADDLDLTAIVATPQALPPVSCDVVVLDVDAQPHPCLMLVGQTRARLGDVGICAISVRPDAELEMCCDRGDVTLVLKTDRAGAVRDAVRAASRSRAGRRPLRV